MWRFGELKQCKRKYKIALSTKSLHVHSFSTILSSGIITGEDTPCWWSQFGLHAATTESMKFSKQVVWTIFSNMAFPYQPCGVHRIHSCGTNCVQSLSSKHRNEKLLAFISGWPWGMGNTSQIHSIGLSSHIHASTVKIVPQCTLSRQGLPLMERHML